MSRFTINIYSPVNLKKTFSTLFYWIINTFIQHLGSFCKSQNAYQTYFYMCERNKLSIISLTSECLLAIFFLCWCINYKKKNYLLDCFFVISRIISLNKSYQPMLKAEADNSYLDLDYSGLKKKLLLIISWNFIKTVSKKTIKICFI